MENFTYYNMYENKMNNKPDEIVYQRMQESSHNVRKTDNGDLYYDTYYGPQVSYKIAYSNDEYTKSSGLLSHYDVVNNKEINKKSIVTYIKSIFCCR